MLMFYIIFLYFGGNLYEFSIKEKIHTKRLQSTKRTDTANGGKYCRHLNVTLQQRRKQQQRYQL